MSVRNRVDAMEKKMGIATRPLIVLLRNVAREPGDGTPEYKGATIIISPDRSSPVIKMRSDETSEEFENRIHEMCENESWSPD
jgi:hypothetical protein